MNGAGLNQWLNIPTNYQLENDSLKFDVTPKSDFWQITHYGFSRTDGNCFVKEVTNDVSFKVKVIMKYAAEFDQAGVIVYYDEENFAKMSVENQLNNKNKLGSVVTKNKRSDWATQHIEKNLNEIWYKISKRGDSYLFENSFDDKEYNQIRLFDIISGTTPLIGVYGASPLGEGFKAQFEYFNFSENEWFLDQNDLPEEYK